MNKRVKRFLWTSISAIVIVGGTLEGVTLINGGNGNTIELVAQPPTAATLVQEMGGTNFHDLGPSQVGGAIDSGWFMLNGKKLAIDTFATKDVRDSWLKSAVQYGVVPKYETETSVTYPTLTK